MATDKKAVPQRKETAEDKDASTPKRKRRRREWVTAIFLLLCCLIGIALGRTGVLWPAFDVFAQFTLHFIFGAVALVIAIPLFRRKPATAGLVIGVMICAAYGFLARQTTFSVPPKAAGAIRVLHFNMYKNNRDPQLAAETVLASGADIVSLVEYQGANRAIAAQLASIYPYTTSCTDSCGNAIFSKFPLQVKLAEDPVIMPHLVWAEAATPVGAVQIVGVHLDRFPRTRQQVRQAGSLARLLAGKTERMVLLGDFNATPWSRVLHDVADGTSLSLQTSVPSWPSQLWLPQLAIDHIFLGPGLSVAAEPRLAEPSGSDHFPVYIDLVTVTK